MTRPRGMQLADYVNELTNPHQHVEAYTIKTRTGWIGCRHITRAPALLTQLWDNDTPSQAAGDGPRPGFKSKPAARLEALDAAVRIDLEASAWVRDLGEDDWHTDTAATIRQLHGLTVSADPVQRRAIEHDVRRWWTQARIVTGWDSPAWSPNTNTCPQCGERGTIKVRLDENIGMCVNDACRATWDETTIGILGEHVRIENSSQEAKQGPPPCQCPWPRPDIPDLRFQCPKCGSARCIRALTRRLLATLAEERVS